MAALTSGRLTKSRSGDRRNFPAAAGARLFTGGLAALTAAGFLVAASADASLKVVGRSEGDVDNADGADGDIRGETELGIFAYDNSSAADEIQISDIGSDAYVVDDQTVALTDGGGTRPVAGKIHDVDAAGVWIDMR